MNDEILYFLKKKLGQKFTVKQLARHLELRTFQQKELKRELKNLLKEGKVILDKNQRYTFRDEQRVIKGRIKVHPEGFGFLIPSAASKSDVFIPKKYMNYAMNGDDVLVESSMNGRDGRYEGRVIQIINRANEIVIGNLMLKGSQHFAVFKDPRLGLDEIYVPKKHLNKAQIGEVVGVKILQFPGPGALPIGEVVNIIGKEDDDEAILEGLLFQSGTRIGFPNEVMSQVDDLPDEVEVEFSSKRIDLTKIPLITIDGVTAKDFDDAVCVVKKGRAYVLYVCIADVAHYVPTGSALDEEAYERATSTYLPNTCIPMLPEKLSNGLCSLNPYVPRYTLTAEMHYNENFHFVKSHFYKSLMVSRHRATYEEVEAFYDGTGGDNFEEAVKKSLKNMKVLAENMIRQSEKRGVLGFDLPEPKIVYDAHGKVAAVDKRQRFFSHKLIEQFMISANVAVAQFFQSREIPQIYRIHDRPDHNKLYEFDKLVANLGLPQELQNLDPSSFFRKLSGHRAEHFLQMVFLRSLKQAHYSPDNIGHYGLSLEDYTHFTSPIRRYPDLIVHRQLKSLLDQTKDGILKLNKDDIHKKPTLKKNLTVYNYEELHEMGKHCSERERSAMEIERKVLDFYKALFVRDFPDQKFYGTISRISKYGMTVELSPHYVDGFLSYKNLKDDYYIFEEKKLRLVGKRTRKSYRIGDKIWVTVAKVGIDPPQILVMPADDMHNDTPKKKRKQKGRKKVKNKKRRPNNQ